MRTCPQCDSRYQDAEQFCSRDGAELSASDGQALDPLIGQRIQGDYLLQARLGEGGMGIVYRAVHPETKKPVAVKVLRSEYTQNQDILARFYQEAHAVGQLEHPNIAKLIDLGTLPNNSPYLVLEYLRGVDLATLVKDEGPLSTTRALTIARQISDALRTAHHAGIIHRDLKPDNVFISPDPAGEQSRILDFGLAKLIKRPSDDVSREDARTRSGVIMGTPYYMSPEQACGKPVDEQTDVYALGVILYEMLTGRVPFRSPDGPLHVLMQHLNEPPPPLSELQPMLPVEVERLVLSCLEKTKERRYPSMEVLYQDLDLLLHGKPPRFAPPKLAPLRSPQRLFWVTSLSLALITAGSLYAFAPWHKPTIINHHLSPITTKPTPASAPINASITLSIETTPPGAQILLGTTPYPQTTPAVLTLSKQDAPITLSLYKEGYEENTQPISLRADLSLRLDLTPKTSVKSLTKKTHNPKQAEPTSIESDPGTPPDQLDPYEKKKETKKLQDR